jgi:hypothetical protein
MRATAWLLVVGIGLCGYLWLNNRISYKYEADLAETHLRIQQAPAAQQQAVRARGGQLNRQLHWIKLALGIQGVGLVVLLTRLNRPSAT